ncbi:MAG: PspC domain-containing protein [Woeseiaceae bacterium]|nr:PspC domain-containing protein [Woeseiaceae bacterium]
MKKDTWNIDLDSLRGLYRDRENGWIFGVCAGLADRFDLHVGTVRLVAVITLALFFWLTVILYLGATLIIREKPLIYSGERAEFEFWRQSRRDYRS